MRSLLKTKRVLIFTLVFLLFAGTCYADYTMPDGTVVKWVSGNTLQVISPDGSSHTTTGTDNGSGRLVPVDNSFNDNRLLASQLPSQNSATQGGMNNTNMTVPIVTNGQISGWADIYGNGTAYQGDTAVRSSNESQGNTVGWNGVNNGYGGGVINITTPEQTTTPTSPSQDGGSSSYGGGGDNGGSNNTYTPPYTPPEYYSPPEPYIPPAPYITGVSVVGPSSAIAAQSYSYTATVVYSDGNSADVTGNASWSNGPNFTPQNDGQYTVSATYAGATGFKQVNVVLPPAATPPGKPSIRLY